MPSDMMPIVMLLNLVVSSVIAIVVYRFTKRQATMETLKLINSRWQEINKLVIERPHIQRLIDDARFANKSDDDIVAMNFLFQIVNVCYEVHFAAAQGLIDDSTAKRFIAGNSDILRNRRTEVTDMLTWGRGYDPDFCRMLQNLLGQSTQDAR